MTIRNLDRLFAPRSIAVIGASPRERSVGGVVMRNLLQGGFGGPVMPVNPKHTAVAGVLAYPSVSALPLVPDLAVVATPPEPIPELLSELGKRGTRAVIVLTAGTDHSETSKGASVTQAMLAAARPYCLRILGPNCVGLLVPRLKLNASFAHTNALPGSVAFVSQSGALCTAALDWARAHGIGFSHFISLGNSADVDLGDVLDFLAGDPFTRSILFYVEGLDEARKFVSAARAASINKPVVAIKSGRVREGARAAASHTGALAGADEVFDAAFARAGILRVDRLDELFDAAQTLARTRPIPGDRLMIVSNGGGPGVMATDTLIAGGGRLAELSSKTFEQLSQLLPITWSHANPIDLVGDAGGSRYASALRIVLDSGDADAVLVVHAPTALASARDVAGAVVAVCQERPPAVPVFSSWLGGDESRVAEQILGEAGLPTYETAEDAVRAFLHRLNYQRSQAMLREVPRSMPALPGAVRTAVEAPIEQARRDGRAWLNPIEVAQVLEAYGIPVLPMREAKTPEAAAAMAKELGFPVALKLLSRDLIHKSDVGGVALDLDSEDQVLLAARAMRRRVESEHPEIALEGFILQPMARRSGAVELIVGMSSDALFGPFALFGEGGRAVEVVRDRAVELLPLNLNLAQRLVGRTRIAGQLAGYRGEPPADREAIEQTLVRVSQLAIDTPRIQELDINPLLADSRGVLALDARIRVGAVNVRPPLAIRPYPSELEEQLELHGEGTLIARPIRPEDEPAHLAFFEQLDSRDVYFRFFNAVRRMPHSELSRYTQIDYDREMAFIAYRPETPNDTLGVVRAIADPDHQLAEFAVIVRSDRKGHGIGRALLEKLIRYAKSRGWHELAGEVLAENRAMLGLARSLGFVIETNDDDAAVVSARLSLT